MMGGDGTEHLDAMIGGIEGRAGADVVVSGVEYGVAKVFGLGGPGRANLRPTWPNRTALRNGNGLLIVRPLRPR